ncbi:hypothetical protein PTSG_05554 [Salpingoeca rosetta]|uniref:Uncharacterized protein n=1 Tax=Salpingoeca rosetta (strain ATCC 50818 / BSB-021) TaxID=946362 RepID=F2UBJ3_SALR5|nr:uncharacterized protein PTSG_05554 [Salpingoeca rosetta]EGD73859.1 hypothetical protein PTSG_05554 [Salpingoeca rosetta]|eukprot:XP_004993422.1 hypothetical protein PTSG_05554 [Salpingoeca rosetta]
MASSEVQQRAAALCMKQTEGVHHKFKRQWYDSDLSDSRKTGALLFDIACLHNGDGMTQHDFQCLARPDVPAAYLVIGVDSSGTVVGCDEAEMTDGAVLSQFLRSRLDPCPEVTVYHTVLKDDKRVFLVEIAVDTSIGQPVRVCSKQHGSLLTRKPARVSEGNADCDVANSVWPSIVSFFCDSDEQQQLYTELREHLEETGASQASPFFNGVRRVLIADQLEEHQAVWLAAIPWHAIISFGANDGLKQAIPQVTGVDVEEFELEACWKKRGGVPPKEVIQNAAHGSTRLFLTAPLDPMDDDTGRIVAQAFQSVYDRVEDAINSDEALPVVYAAVLNGFMDRFLETAWRRMLQHSSSHVVLVGISSQRGSDRVWQEFNELNVVDMWQFSCTNTVLPMLADTMGTTTSDLIIDLPTRGTIHNEDLAPVQGYLTLMYAPESSTTPTDNNLSLRDLQLRFLQGGVLTAQLLRREKQGDSCVVRRDFHGILARELEDAIASDDSSQRIIAVSHGRTTGASTVVRHVLLNKAMANAVTAFELYKIPRNEKQRRAVVALLQLVHERSSSPVVCLVDNDDVTPGQVLQFVQSTALHDIPQLVFVVTSRRMHRRKTQRDQLELPQPSIVPSTRHLQLAGALTEKEMEGFEAVFSHFSGMCRDHSGNSNGGRDAGFLWGCALMANKEDAVLAHIVEHVAWLPADEARALQAVAVTSGLANSSLPLFAAERLLVDQGAVDWPFLQAKRCGFTCLVRFHGSRLCAPLPTDFVCRSLFQAAVVRLRDASVTVSSITSALWDPVALFDTVEQLLCILEASCHNDDTVQEIMRRLFAATSSDLLHLLNRDQGQQLYELAIRTSPSKHKAHLLAEQGQHVALHSEGSMALIHMAYRLAEDGVARATQQGASLRTLSTLIGIRAHVLKVMIQAQLETGESPNTTLAAALADAEHYFQRDADHDNTQLAVALCTMAIDVAKHMESADPMRDMALNAALHWASQLQLCITSNRAEDPEKAREKLRTIWAALESLRPPPQRSVLQKAVADAEHDADDEDNIDVDEALLSSAPQLRQSSWQTVNQGDATIIFRCLTQLLKRRSKIASFYHVQEWIHAAVACDDTQMPLHAIAQSEWYRWVVQQVDRGQLQVHGRGTVWALWQQWLLTVAVLSGVNTRIDGRTSADTPLWYLQTRMGGEAMISDIRMTKPEHPSTGELDRECNVRVRVHGRDLVVPFLNPPTLERLAANIRVRPFLPTQVRVFLVVKRASLYAKLENP